MQVAGFAGALALHVLPVPAASHTSVPEFVAPHALAVEVQEFPSPLTFAGAETEQAPLHWMVPEFVAPQLLAEEVQALPWFTSQETGPQPVSMQKVVPSGHTVVELQYAQVSVCPLLLVSRHSRAISLVRRAAQPLIVQPPSPTKTVLKDELHVSAWTKAGKDKMIPIPKTARRAARRKNCFGIFMQGVVLEKMK